MHSKRLIIISDTPMWRDADGNVNVYEPTLREIEQLSVLFEEIIWLGFSRANYRFGVGRKTVSQALTFRLLYASGGHTFLSKLKSLLLLPYYFYVITKYISKADYIHTRGPSVPALIAIVLSFVFRKKRYWHKYAGNWNAEQAPFFYRFQKRILLKATFSKVTLNGEWKDQLSHTISFDNPCLTDEEADEANQNALKKRFSPPFTLCFIGRLEEAKGVGNLIKSLGRLEHKGKVRKLLLAGGGENVNHYLKLASTIEVPVEFMGSLNREELNKVYAESHILVLPSLSEGFPKVISEGIAFGCIPTITAISSLTQYFADNLNGYIMVDNSIDTIAGKLDSILIKDNLAKVSSNARELTDKFRYKSFVKRIAREVFEL